VGIGFGRVRRDVYGLFISKLVSHQTINRWFTQTRHPSSHYLGVTRLPRIRGKPEEMDLGVSIFRVFNEDGRGKHLLSWFISIQDLESEWAWALRGYVNCHDQRR